DTVINAVVVTAIGLTLAWLAKGRFEAIQRQIEAVEERVLRLDGRVDGLQSSLDAMWNQFHGSLDAMRSDLTRVALAVGAGPRAENA
ncbi:MAG: hypothetical protein ACRDH1_04790, partial [Actinomycetota bacterium]